MAAFIKLAVYGLIPEVHENPAKVLVVFLQPVIESFYLRLEQESQDVFLQLS